MQMTWTSSTLFCMMLVFRKFCLLGSKTQARNTSEKDHFVKIIARHILLDRPRYLLEELIDGLRTLGVYEKIKENPKEFACLCRVCAVTTNH